MVAHFDAPALTAKIRFSGNNVAGSGQWVVPVNDGAGTPFVEGDFCFVTQIAKSSGTYPGVIIPPGWQTEIASVVTTRFNGVSTDYYRAMTYTKRLVAADIGTNFAGMVGSLDNLIYGLAFHFNRPLRAVPELLNQSSSLVSAGAVGSYSASTIPAQRNGAVLITGCASTENPASPPTNAEFFWSAGPIGSEYVTSVAPPDLGAVTNTRQYYSFYAQGRNDIPSSILTTANGVKSIYYSSIGIYLCQ